MFKSSGVKEPGRGGDKEEGLEGKKRDEEVTAGREMRRWGGCEVGVGRGGAGPAVCGTLTNWPPVTHTLPVVYRYVAAKKK